MLVIGYKYTNIEDHYQIKYPDAIDLMIRIFGTIKPLLIFLKLFCGQYNNSYYLKIMYKQIFKLKCNDGVKNFLKGKSFEESIGKRQYNKLEVKIDFKNVIKS